MTAVIQIGNSDDKLSQADWSHYIAAVKRSIETRATRVHFCGGSDWEAPWQNACWVIEVPSADVADLVEDLTKQRRLYEQESIAWTTGVTKFI